MKRLWAWIKGLFVTQEIASNDNPLPANSIVEADTVCRLKPVLRSILQA